MLSNSNSITSLDISSYCRKILQRWLSLCFMFALGLCIWHLNPYFKKQIPDEKVWTVIMNISFVWTFCGLLWETLRAYIKKEDYFIENSNSVLFIQALCRGFKNVKEQEKQAILFWLVHVFYLPLMASGLIYHIQNFNYVENILDLQQKLLNVNWLFSLVYFLDIIPFALAYFINCGDYRTRSVDTSLIGWLFCLSCYAPFNNIWASFFPYNHTEAEGILAWVSLFFITIYAASSLSLGLRAGHLQYRGLCDTGTYAIVRHPAYGMKNLAWFVGAISWAYNTIVHADTISSAILPISLNFIAAFFVMWVYHNRAITEERHLLEHKEYQDYCKRVKYRYIPFVY